jgi:hypothetical protein
VLAEIASRLAAVGEAAPRLAMRLAERRLRREEWGEAAALLGEGPPARDLRDLWFRLRTLALAGEGRSADLRAAFAAWERAGGDPAELRARYAATLSVFLLDDPGGRPTGELLERAAADADRLDPQLARIVLARLIGLLRLAGSPRAVTWYDRAVARFGRLPQFDRADLAAAPAALAGGRTAGTLVFRVAGAEPGDRLLLSPDAEQPVDDDYRALAVPAGGRVLATRRGGATPQRWVLHDRAGRTRGSGAVWPVADRTVEIEVARRAPAGRSPGSPASAASPASAVAPSGRRPGDGRRRVAVVILDCGDWRLVQYLRTRGELPVLDRLLAAGYRAVLDSYPAYTAVAIRSLVEPAVHGVDSFLALLHQLGAEIEGLNFVGANPAAGLAWLLPGGESLFATLGAGPLTTANLLRSFGPLQVGRQAETVGPYGRLGRLAGYRGARPLGDEERAAFPALAVAGSHGDLVAEIAADLDTAAALSGDPAGPDLFLLRVAALDVLTHAYYAAAARGGQDDGAGFLYALYRYLDARLGAVDAALDADDVLVVMSDHGIRTALEHDRQALFVAVGGGAPAGRCPGTPALRGVGRMLADLVGVETGWPATGIEAWVAGAGPPGPPGETSGRPPPTYDPSVGQPRTPEEKETR